MGAAIERAGLVGSGDGEQGEEGGEGEPEAGGGWGVENVD